MELCASVSTFSVKSERFPDTPASSLIPYFRAIGAAVFRSSP